MTLMNASRARVGAAAVLVALVILAAPAAASAGLLGGLLGVVGGVVGAVVDVLAPPVVGPGPFVIHFEATPNLFGAPNGTQPIWAFDHTVPGRTANVSIAYSPTRPSFLVLPVIPGFDAPTPLPPCPSLRNEPCRAYVAIENRTATQ